MSLFRRMWRQRREVTGDAELPIWRASKFWAIVIAVAVAGGFVAIGFLADSHTKHGLTAKWYMMRRGMLEKVVLTIEHRTHFPNRLRAAARYVENWDLERWPNFPSSIPQVDARFSGYLDVPEGPYRWIELVSPNEVFINVDGQPVTRLPPGRHQVEIGWDGNMVPKAFLEMRWGTRSGIMERIPDSAFTPMVKWPSARIAVWIVTPLLMLFFGFGAYLIARAPSARRRARRVAIWSLSAISLIGLSYRLYDYTVLPEFSSNHDGLFVMWNGYSLLEDGSSRGWTVWEDFYEEQPGAELEEMFYFQRTKLKIVSPYLEHPPLFHLMVGAFLHAVGTDSWRDADLSMARLVPIALQIVSILLVYAIGRRLIREGVSPYLGALLYAAMPNVVLQSRSVKEESLMTPLALFVVWLFLRYRDLDFRKRDLVFAAICAGLCPLTKMPGLAMIGVLLVLVLAQGRWRDAVLAFSVSSAVASLIFVYAAIMDWDLFWAVQKVQATTRGSNWNVLVRFFTFAKVDHNAVGIGWLLFMWFGWMFGAARRAREQILPIVFPVIAYTVAIAVASGTWTFGWYLMPVYPFLCLGAGLFLGDFLKRPTLIAAFFFATFALMYTFNYLVPVHFITIYEESDPALRSVVLSFLVFALGPFVAYHVFPNQATERGARFVALLAIFAFVGFSGRYIFEYEKTYQEYEHFDNVTREYRTQ